MTIMFFSFKTELSFVRCSGNVAANMSHTLQRSPSVMKPLMTIRGFGFYATSIEKQICDIIGATIFMKQITRHMYLIV